MRYIRMFFAMCCVFCIIFTAFWGAEKLTENVLSGDSVEYKGIIKVWQIDSFEGGIGSRKQFLLKVARGFERQNKGVLIMVSQFTEEGVAEQIKNGNYPDVISYGNGVDVSGVCQLTSKRAVKGGVVGDKMFATAWCRGGYVLIENPNCNNSDNKNIVILSQQKYTQPLVALFYEGLDCKNIEQNSPMDAYIKFVSGKGRFLLGTQRDIIRLTNRGFEFLYTPISRYNDLYQYVSVFSNDENRLYYAQKFVDYLLDDKVQNMLSEIGLMSPYISIEHGYGALNDMQLVKNELTVSAFIAREELVNLQSLSIDLANGNEVALNKIKNIVI